MKKLTLVAAGVMSMIAAPVMAQSTVTLYGLIDAAVTYTTKQTAAGLNRTGIDAGQRHGCCRFGLWEPNTRS